MPFNEKYMKNLVLFVVYGLFIMMFWPFKQSILFAGLFAMALTPTMKKYKKHFKDERWLVVTVVTALMGIFILPLTIIIINGLVKINQMNDKGIDQLDIYKKVELSVNSGLDFVNDLSMQFHINILEQINFKAILPKVTTWILSLITQMAAEIPSFTLQFIVFISCLYYFLHFRIRLRQWIIDIKFLPEQSIINISDFLQKTCSIVVVSTVLVAAVQALIVTIAAMIAGYNDFLILFMIMFFMSFIPVIGSGPLSVALAIYSFMQGHVFSGIILSIAAFVASIIDNVIKTYILSSQEDSVHPLISLLSLIGAVIMFGFSGLFLGPIISHLAFSISSFLTKQKKNSLSVEAGQEP